MTINEWAKKVHENAINHGWWESDCSVSEIIALCHAELSESLEEDRKGADLVYIAAGKPEGVAVELIDCMIRIMDYLEHENVDIEQTLSIKHAYNIGREYKHGKRY